ncbi:MAG: PhoH family protein [Elusimicrobia bacterium]|nr:PhoH family protein [Elusimicrobiota bacterium]
MKKRLYLNDSDETLDVLGEQDKNIIQLEKDFDVRIYCMQEEKSGRYILEITGPGESVRAAMNRINEKREQGARSKKTKGDIPRGIRQGALYVSCTGKQITPFSNNQRAYLEYIKDYDLVIGIGPAGTGKTFLAVVSALAMLESGKVNRIILTRPVVEAGEKLGFLPGDLYDKVNPYLKPLYDAFYYLIGPEKFRRYRENETIEIVPLAYMRGRTLEDAFIILDEAQNTIPEQMKMFLTRLGFGSQAVITGDITQIDIENKRQSGLVQSEKILSGVSGIKFVRFSEEDVVRHDLVREIIKAYDVWEGRLEKKRSPEKND